MKSRIFVRAAEGIKSYFARLTAGSTAKDSGRASPGVSKELAAKRGQFPPGREPSTPGSLEFTAAALHLLSQPLTALRGSLELALLTESSAEEYRRNLEESLALANHLAGLIRSLRRLIELETHPEVSKTVPLKALVEKAAQDLRGMAESRNVGLAIQADAACNVEAGPETMRQVALKAIHHAIDRSPAGKVVGISLASGDGRVFLAVSDQGERLSPEDLERFFKPFSPGGAAARSSVEGLEWLTAKRAVETAGGSVQAESGTDQGFCLRIILPEAPKAKQ